MKPLEILHVIESLGEGGAEQNLLSFVKQLDPGRYRHHLAWLFDDERLLERFRPHVQTLIPLGAGHGVGMLGAIWRLGRWMRKLRPDVVHAQLIRAQVVARAASVLAGAPPVVTTWQTPYYEPSALADFANSERRRATVRLIDRLTSPIDRRFIAVSAYVAERQQHDLHVDASRVRVIYNSVEPTRYGAADAAVLARTREALRLRPDARILLNVGRLVPQKAQSDLIAAMPGILARFPEVVLLIAGRGPLHDELRAQAAALGVAHAVHLLGAREDVPVLYQLAHLFVFPSLYEGLGVAVLEALANGLPAVLSDIPPIREVADGLESVRFVPVRSPDRIVSATIDLLAAYDANLDAARSARIDVQQRYSPHVLARQFGDMLAEVAAR